jgi:hypothetical protein
MGGVDVEKAQLVCAGFVVGAGRVNRVARVAQVNEVHTFHNAAVCYVETGDDAGLEHGNAIFA